MKTITTTLLVALSTACAAGSLAAGDPGPAVVAPSLYCKASLGTAEYGWIIAVDESIPLAVVNDADAPAEYTPAHIKIRLSVEGPELTFGRNTGRLLVTTPSGSLIGLGSCIQLTADTTPTSVPAATDICPATANDRLGRKGLGKVSI